jgi:hypothetical protein
MGSSVSTVAFFKVLWAKMDWEVFVYTSDGQTFLGGGQRKKKKL